MSDAARPLRYVSRLESYAFFAAAVDALHGRARDRLER